MQANRGKNTGPERLLRQALRGAGMRGYRLQWRTPAGRIDIAYPGKKVAIHVHGCFWHRCPRCCLTLPKSNTDFWRGKFERNVQRDAKTDELLVAMGWTVLTAWECELRDDLSVVVDRIRKAVRG